VLAVIVLSAVAVIVLATVGWTLRDEVTAPFLIVTAISALGVIVAFALAILSPPHFAAEIPPPCCVTSSPGGARPPIPPQQIFAATLHKDMQSLDRGVFAYSPITGLETSAMTTFEVEVTDVGRGPQLGRYTGYDGMVVYQQDVPTGGIVGVQIVSCENLTCLAESSFKQLVLVPGEVAVWYWQITAGIPGPAKIIVRADTYDQGSDQTLREELIQINAEVLPTAAYTHQQSHAKIAHAAKSVVDDIVTIGSVATAILAVGGVVAWIFTRRRKQGKPNQRKQESQTSESSGSAVDSRHADGSGGS
jgi:hypothetical protein